MLIRILVVLGLVLAAAALAIQIGSRLSDQAIMTLLGVFCGVAASIPVSIGLLLALTGTPLPRPRRTEPLPTSAQPRDPVIFIYRDDGTLKPYEPRPLPTKYPMHIGPGPSKGRTDD